MKEPIFYVDGNFIPQSQACLNVTNIGLLRGYGVFDFTRTYNRKPFRLKDHLNRLWNSADIIGLDLPWSKKELAELIYKTLEKNPYGEKSIRIVLTGGESSDTFTLADTPSLIIMVKPVKIYPKEMFEKGVKVITFPGKREISEAKTLNYLYGVKALKKAKLEGAEEAIYACNGVLYECMACSFFAVKDKKIITSGNDILDGITRKTVLELVEGKIPVEYRFIKLTEIAFLDEVFLTSSSHEVMPIVIIDKTKIGKGKPGPITIEIMKMFKEYTQQLFESF